MNHFCSSLGSLYIGTRGVTHHLLTHVHPTPPRTTFTLLPTVFDGTRGGYECCITSRLSRLGGGRRYGGWANLYPILYLISHKLCCIQHPVTCLQRLLYGAYVGGLYRVNITRCMTLAIRRAALAGASVTEAALLLQTVLSASPMSRHLRRNKTRRRRGGGGEDVL